MQENFATLLEVVAENARSEVAVVQGRRRRTWSDLEHRAARLAGALASAGVAQGDRVAVGLYNGVEYLETVFAAMKLRATPVNINYRYRERELLHVLESSAASAMVFDATLEARIAAISGALPQLATFVRLGSNERAGVEAIDYDQAVVTTPPAPRSHRGDDEWLLYTGGTTGPPKGVRAPHSWLFVVAMGGGYRLLEEPAPRDLADLAARTRAIAERGAALRCLVACPLMHGTGIFSALGVLLTGGTVILLPDRSFNPDTLAAQVESHRATDLVIVGDAFGRPLAETLESAAAAGRPYDLASLQRIRSVGAPWSAEVKERLLQHCDAELRDTIAATEGGPFATSVTTRGTRGVTSRFVLAPGARVLDEAGRDIVPGSGEVGLLAAPADDDIHYLGDPGATAGTYRVIAGRRWCIPGDMATVEADGSLVFKGRGNRVINTGGEKVFAEEVEEVLGLHPDVADVYVVGVPDERFGQRIAAVIQPRPGTSLSKEDVADFVGQHLAGYKRPRVVTFVPRLQRQLTGKADLAWAYAVATGVATSQASGMASRRGALPRR
jgi:3-oxocholest-4-en-26-oate---CoA ligase